MLLLHQVQAEQNQIRGQLEKAEHELISVKKEKDELHKKLQSSEHAMNSYNSTVANFEAKVEKLQKEKVSSCTGMTCDFISLLNAKVNQTLTKIFFFFHHGFNCVQFVIIVYLATSNKHTV